MEVCQEPTYFVHQQTAICELGYADAYNHFCLMLPYSTSEECQSGGNEKIVAEANEALSLVLIIKINLLFCNCNPYVDMPSVHAHRQDYLKGYKVGKKECTVEVHEKNPWVIETKPSDEFGSIIIPCRKELFE
jgi:hypothetical protein